MTEQLYCQKIFLFASINIKCMHRKGRFKIKSDSQAQIQRSGGKTETTAMILQDMEIFGVIQTTLKFRRIFFKCFLKEN